MISTARSFGAPVIDPPGKVARKISSSGSPSRVFARTVDTRWCTVGSVTRRAKPSTSHRARRRHAPEIVAQKVHDHEVLGRVLGRGAQLRRQPRVLVGRRRRAAAFP